MNEVQLGNKWNSLTDGLINNNIDYSREICINRSRYNFYFLKNEGTDNRKRSGVLFYSNGNKYYEGELVDGKKHGKGIMYDIDGNKMYEGEWRYDKRVGNGICYIKGGKIYEGYLNDDNWYGQGTFFDENGEKSLKESVIMVYWIMKVHTIMIMVIRDMKVD